MKNKLVKESIDDLFVPKSEKDIIKGLSNLSQEKKNQMLLNASIDQLNKVKLLIKTGADINAKNINGYTALMYASATNRLEIIKYLIENGADVNAKNKRGETSLTFAYRYYYNDMINLLKKHGAIE